MDELQGDSKLFRNPEVKRMDILYFYSRLLALFNIKLIAVIFFALPQKAAGVP